MKRTRNGGVRKKECGNADALRTIKRFFTAFFCMWLLSAALVLARGEFYLKLHDPTLSFWYDNGNDAHADLAGFNPRTQRFTSKETGAPVVVYPAPMMTVYMALTRWTAFPVRLYAVIISFIALAIALLLGKLYGSVVLHAPLTYLSAIVMMAFFYPLWFVFERSNVEAILWLPTTLGAIALVSRRYKTAAILVALAASLKIYPGILLLVFFREKRYRELVLSLTCCLSFTVLGLWWLDPNLITAWREMYSGMTRLTNAHLTLFEGPAIGYDHSFFSVVKQIIRLRFPAMARYHYELLGLKVAGAMRVYVPVAALGFAVAFMTYIRKMNVLNQVIVLLILSVTLPPVSYEYTLLQVLPAYAFLSIYLIQESAAAIPVPGPWRVAVACSFIVVSLPLSFIGGSTVGYGGQIKLFALLTPIAFCFSHRLSFRRETAWAAV